jgi:hypothetical protein
LPTRRGPFGARTLSNIETEQQRRTTSPSTSAFYVSFSKPCSQAPRKFLHPDMKLRHSPGVVKTTFHGDRDDEHAEHDDKRANPYRRKFKLLSGTEMCDCFYVDAAQAGWI